MRRPVQHDALVHWRNSPAGRAFSIAITACAAKLCNSAISLSVNGRASFRSAVIAPNKTLSLRNGTRSRTRMLLSSINLFNCLDLLGPSQSVTSEMRKGRRAAAAQRHRSRIVSTLAATSIPQTSSQCHYTLAKSMLLSGLRRPVAAFNVVQSTSAADARPDLTVVARGPGPN